MELLYHYLWKHKMMGRELRMSDGTLVNVLSVGRYNTDAGPDFSNARIMVGGREWIGNVEIHVKASDWYAHGHDRDKAYDSVVLHVVAVNDAEVRRIDGSVIPQVEVLLPRNFYITYSRLTADMKGTRCQNMLHSIPPLVCTDWLESLGMERMQAKASRLMNYYTQLNSDWEQAVFTLLARGLGFGLNSLPFEMLAKNLPQKYLYHHADDLLQTEALLFGQAGLLDPGIYPYEDYYQALCREYMFLQRKYGLRPQRREVWKYARTRPQNFPHRRIALLAAAVHKREGFSSGLVEAGGDIDRLMELFDWRLDGYWGTHCGFGPEGGERVVPRTLSDASKELLIINVAAPFYYAYAAMSGDLELGERGINMLTRLRPERNSIISSWQVGGLKVPDALRSQALLHLRSEYCDRNRCLECRFGHYLLRHRAGGHLFDYNRISDNVFVDAYTAERLDRITSK